MIIIIVMMSLDNYYTITGCHTPKAPKKYVHSLKFISISGIDENMKAHAFKLLNTTNFDFFG